LLKEKGNWKNRGKNNKNKGRENSCREDNKSKEVNNG
jgi:hypothetical protein